MSKLIEALKTKFKTPQEALLALGLDADILEVDVLAEDRKERPMAKYVMTRKAAMLQGALIPFLKPRLAADAKIDLIPIVNSVTSKNYKTKKAEIVKQIIAATKGKLAKDANIEGLVQLIDALEGEAPMEVGDAPLEMDPNTGVPMKGTMQEAGVQKPIKDVDPAAAPMPAPAPAAAPAPGCEELVAFLKSKGMADEDIAKACQLVEGGEGGGETPAPAAPAPEKKEEPEKPVGQDEEGLVEDPNKKVTGDEPPPFAGKPEVGGGMSKDEDDMVSKGAMDAAIAKAVKEATEKQALANDAKIKAASDAANKNARETREAENDVRPWVGTLSMAHDSAADVYRTSLTMLGEKAEDIQDLPVKAMRAILKKIPQPGQRSSMTVVPAMDSAAVSDFAKRNPQAAAIEIG